MRESNGARAGHENVGEIRCLVLMLVAVVAAQPSLGVETGVAMESGYRTLPYGSEPHAGPTGQKPESKLWFQDGAWWGCLFDVEARRYAIFRFQSLSQGWLPTGVAIDDRPTSSADVLWHEATGKLYVASHLYRRAEVPSEARLYRFSYDSGVRRHVLDEGFPVTIYDDRSESLVLARDSLGVLWATWMHRGRVMVASTSGDDRHWSVPRSIPDAAAVATSDDLSSIIALGDRSMGLMWSNQERGHFYFALHRDADPPETWQVEKVPRIDGGGALFADDHLSLKAVGGPDGTILYAAVKTSYEAEREPLVLVLVRRPDGAWSHHVAGLKADQHTRPVVAIDDQTRRLWLIATAPEKGGALYYKTAFLEDLRFPPGRGEPLIEGGPHLLINNATTTKQSVSSRTGLLVLASDRISRSYYHRYLPLPAP